MSVFENKSSSHYYNLRNAFGEVHHDLIRSVMDYHHLPAIFTDLFDAIYTDSYVRIAVNRDWTSDLPVSKGVLQGDPCSPLLFNLCFNTLMHILHEKKLENLGYIWGPDGHANECAWLQFADDAVVVSNSVRDAQTLINIFAAWCKWARMDIRLDKCCTYGAGKRNGMYAQFEPQLFINSQPVPSIAQGESFIYLGKIFDFKMNNDAAKRALCKKFSNLLDITSSLKIKSQLKLRILQQYIYSQISHELKTYPLGDTWIDQNLDSILTTHIRSWLGLPISTCIKEMLTLPKNRGGFGIPTTLHIYKKLQLAKRSALRNSAHSEIRQIWSDTSSKNICTDSLLYDSDGTSEAKKTLQASLISQAEFHVHSLILQGQAVKVITEFISKSGIGQWSRIVEALPDFLFRFVKKALQQQLPTASNLARWKRIASPNCILCGKSIPQTNKHILSHCAYLLDRYSERHNRILEKIVRWIDSHKSPKQLLAVDLPFSSFIRIDTVFKPSIRPDIVLYDESSISILELTVCHETNFLKSKNYKLNKYKEARIHLQNCFKHIPVQVYTAEISVLGIVSDLSDFFNAAHLPNFSLAASTELSRDAIKYSFEIYKLRNSVNVQS